MPAEPPDELQATLREVQFLRRLAQAAASTQAPDALLKLIIEETTEAMATDVASLYLWEAASETLVLWSTNGLSQEAVGTARMVLGEGITGWVAQSRTPLAVPDVRRDPRFKWIAGVDQDRFVSMLSVPIESGPRMVGVLNVQTDSARQFGEADVAFMSAIAGQVAGIIERSQLQRQLEAQLQEIRSSHDIHAAFTRLSLAGSGPAAILEAIEALAASPVELYDADGYRLSRLRRRERSGLPARISPLEQPAEPRGRVLGRRETVVFTRVPVRAGEQLLGILAAQEPPGEVDPAGRRQALEHGATVLALELAKERAAAEVERRLRGELLDALLDAGVDSAEGQRLSEQAERLGQRIPERGWVAVLSPDDDASALVVARASVQDRVLGLLTDRCARRRPGTVVAARGSQVVLLIPEGGGEGVSPAVVLALLADMLAALRPMLRPASMSAGLGNVARRPSELGRSHQQAQQTLRLSRRGGARGSVVSYHGLGAFRLLLEVERPEALRQYVDETLGPLLAYSRERDTPLLETLEAMVDARWNRRAAARALGVHINSLLYRLQRIEAICGLSLEDAENRVSLAIALRARTLLAQPEQTAGAG